MKILVTGFKPFLKESINPSEKLALELKREFSDIHVVILPVEFSNSFSLLEKEIAAQNPEYVVMFGQASGRKNVCLEKIALNWVQSEHPDENRQIPEAGKISSQEELALMTSFPVDSVYQNLKSKNYPVEISFSAGTYVCNDLYYRVLSRFPKIKAVFVHVPLLPEQNPGGDKPTMALAMQYSVVRELIHSLRGN